jgi:hypothetical protein
MANTKTQNKAISAYAKGRWSRLRRLINSGAIKQRKGVHGMTLLRAHDIKTGKTTARKRTTAKSAKRGPGRPRKVA